MPSKAKVLREGLSACENIIEFITARNAKMLNRYQAMRCVIRASSHSSSYPALSQAHAQTVYPNKITPNVSWYIFIPLRLCVADFYYMTVQGMTQHWQSSPHQHGALTGPGLTIDVVLEVVDAGIFADYGEDCAADKCDAMRDEAIPNGVVRAETKDSMCARGDDVSSTIRPISERMHQTMAI